MARSIDDLHEVATGPRGRVVLTPGCRKALGDATEKQRVRFEKFAEKAVTYGFDEMPEEQFKFEARLPAGRPGGERIAIYAFKPWKLRIYGGFVHHDGKQVFIATLAEEKKRDKGSREALERAAEKLAEFL